MKTIKEEIIEYIEFLKTLSPCKMTHYEQLEESWGFYAYAYIHDKLEEHGFKNGVLGQNMTPHCKMWWEIYSKIDYTIYSKYLKTNVARHHSSAFERNEALIKELEDLVDGAGENA